MNIESLKTLADERFNHALYRKNIKERIESQLVVTHNNGLFKATQHLIAFLNAWNDDTIYLEDEYNNPIECDRVQLLTALKEAYQFAMNQWHNDFTNSKKIRKL